MTSVELVETAIALRPQLLLRARELCGRRAELDAEDLVQDVYVVFVAKPPDPRGATQLKHWLRVVMRNRFIDAQRRRRDNKSDLSFDVLINQSQ